MNKSWIWYIDKFRIALASCVFADGRAGERCQNGEVEQIFLYLYENAYVGKNLNGKKRTYVGNVQWICAAAAGSGTNKSSVSFASFRDADCLEWSLT